jgi:replication-associated recombination protein RarA
MLILIGHARTGEAVGILSAVLFANWVVHQFRPLSTTEIRQLLEQRCTPADMKLPAQPWADDAVAAIVRIAGGNFPC